jgi:hypothetical protein
MAGLVPAIHVSTALRKKQVVDARHKAGHDGGIFELFFLIWPYRRERAITRNKRYLLSLQDITDTLSEVWNANEDLSA